MEQKTGKTALIVAAVGVATILLILLCYYLINGPEDVSEIALPDYTVITSDEPEQTHSAPLATVTADNVLQVFESLTPLEMYHGVYTLEYYWENGSAQHTAEIWNRGTAQKIVVTEGENTSPRHILLREDGSWLWYDGETPIEMPESGQSVADLLGVPEYHVLKEEYDVVEADFATLAGNIQTSCIYVRWNVSENRSITCWISPDTGLLIRAIIEEDGAMVYRMQQHTLERLLPGDDAYQMQFLLPGESE